MNNEERIKADEIKWANIKRQSDSIVHAQCRQLLSEKEAEIQRLKEENEAYENQNKIYAEQISYLKEQRVKDIEDTWDAALAALGKIHERHQGDKLMPKEQAKFIASLMEKDLEKEKSSYLKPFTADSK
jgi:hypothetical protein